MTRREPEMTRREAERRSRAALADPLERPASWFSPSGAIVLRFLYTPRDRGAAQRPWRAGEPGVVIVDDEFRDPTDRRRIARWAHEVRNARPLEAPTNPRRAWLSDLNEWHELAARLERIAAGEDAAIVFEQKQARAGPRAHSERHWHMILERQARRRIDAALADAIDMLVMDAWGVKKSALNAAQRKLGPAVEEYLDGPMVERDGQPIRLEQLGQLSNFSRLGSSEGRSCDEISVLEAFADLAAQVGESIALRNGSAARRRQNG